MNQTINFKKTLSKIGVLNFLVRLKYVISKKGIISGIYNFLIIDAVSHYRNKKFDKVNNIHTSQILEVNKLGITSNQIKDLNRYQPVSIRHLQIICDFIIQKLDKDFEIFLDVGTGLGRPVFFASQKLEFIKKFVGIDLSKKLISSANNNLINFNKINKNTSKFIHFLNQDALKYNFVERKHIIFLFNPFSVKILELFLIKNLSLIKKTKSIIVYVNEPKSNFLNKNFKLIFEDDYLDLKIFK